MIIIVTRISIWSAVIGIIKLEINFFSLVSQQFVEYRIRREGQCLTVLWFVMVYHRIQRLFSD